MLKKNHYFISTLLLITILQSLSCAQSSNDVNLINTSHLDFLYEEIKIENNPMGIIHIYSNYPDYEWIGDDDEGIACVDDAARAEYFYLKHYQFTNVNSSLEKAKKLLKFVLYMQAENGFFYNFIWEDHSINKTFKTSVAEPNWWSWRAMWVLMDAYTFFKENDPKFSEEILQSINKSIGAVKKIIPQKYGTKNINGFERPAWLPYEFASDQSAIMLLSLVPYYQLTKDGVIKKYCEKLIDGIILMQEGNKTSFPYGAFISWENLWHGWGNMQAYALLNLYEVFKNDSVKQSALKEIDNFYQYLIDKNYFIELIIEKQNDKIISKDEKKFSQIAYMIRPLIYSCMNAYKITNDSSYAVKAGKIAGWFFVENPASSQMYFPEDGKCYDGILSETELNKNSGAESTIEALLSLLEIEKSSIARKELIKIIQDSKNKKLE